MDTTGGTSNWVKLLPSSLRKAVAWETGRQRLKKAFGMVVDETITAGNMRAAEPSKRQSKAPI